MTASSESSASGDDGSARLERFIEMLVAARASPTRAAFVQLHRDLNALEFVLLVDRSGWAPSVPDPELKRGLLRCAAPQCRATWRTPDACLLRVADAWYCRQHHPVREYGLHDPGWMPPYKEPPPT